MISHAQHSDVMDQERRVPLGQSQSSRQPRDTQRYADVTDLSDHAVGGADLHQSLQRALRSAARATRREGLDGEPDESSRRALDEVCEMARRDELRVEQLLILLKDAWKRLPEVRQASRLDADFTLTRVITHCIKSYFRPRRPS